MKIKQDFIPKGRRNRPGLTMTPAYITIHDTANNRAGADAEAHARFLKSGAARIPVSWHFTVDDRQVIQHLPLDEVGWHAGDGRNGQGNRTSVGVEICENADGNRAQAEKNAAELVVWLLEKLNLGFARVVQHHHWGRRKNCPRVLRGRPGGWEEFLDMIQDYLAEREVSRMEKTRTHVVKSGDTLGEIAQQYRIALDDLLKENPGIRNPSLIIPGQVIRIPQQLDREIINGIEQIEFVCDLIKDILIAHYRTKR